MPHVSEWPDAPELSTERLVLEPLRVDHADEMAPLLDDPGLHTFIGGTPAGLDDLRHQYAHQVVGHSPDGTQRWFNWIVRGSDGAAVGTVQATVTGQAGRCIADVAWVIASAHQRQGYARDAATAMVAWLRTCGAATLVAYIHPRHHASMSVARALGFTPTEEMVDGEVRWTA